MQPKEYKAKLEEELSVLKDWPVEKAMMAYRLLYNSCADCRVDGIEQRIELKIRARCAEMGA